MRRCGDGERADVHKRKEATQNTRIIQGANTNEQKDWSQKGGVGDNAIGNHAVRKKSKKAWHPSETHVLSVRAIFASRGPIRRP